MKISGKIKYHVKNKKGKTQTENVVEILEKSGNLLSVHTN